MGVCLFLAACATEEVKSPILPWTPPASTQQISAKNAFLADVLDYKDSSRRDIPLWVTAYFNGENIENLPQYRGKYLFVSRQIGNDLNVLSQLTGDVEKDFPLLIASRVQKSLTRNIKIYPDAEYGAFFEEAVKAFYDANFEGIIKEDDFWIKRRITQEDGMDSETFDFLTLVSVDKNILVLQINTLLFGVNPSEEPTREQASAIIHIKNNFFNYF
jgi:hypothetical protein